MACIWNIYEPCDPEDQEAGVDPYDIFVYALRRDEAPHVGDLVYSEGRNRKVIACTADWNMTEVQAQADDVYYKVCIV